MYRSFVLRCIALTLENLNNDDLGLWNHVSWFTGVSEEPAVSISTEGTGCFILKREAAIFSETLVNCYRTARQYIVFGSKWHTERQFVTLPCLPVNIEHVCLR